MSAASRGYEAKIIVFIHASILLESHEKRNEKHLHELCG